MAEINGSSLSGLFTINSDSKECQLTFNAYNGGLRMAVFRGKGRPDPNISVDPSFRMTLIDVCTQVLKAQPGYKMFINLFGWNPQTKKREETGTITIGIDENSIFYIEIRAANQAPAMFPLKGSRLFEVGTDSMTNGARSMTHFKALIDFMKNQWPVALLMSKTSIGTQVKSKASGSNFSSNNNSSSNSGSSYSAGSEDDIY